MENGRRVIILLVLAGLFLTATTNADLMITEIMSRSRHHFDTNGDWWELTNTGALAVDLMDYSWCDDHQIPGTNVFGNISIAAGESIIILDTVNPDSVDDWKSMWGLLPKGVNVYDDVIYFSDCFSGLGESDGVFLYDASDSLVNFVEYPNRMTGFSNEWAIDGTYLGLSVIGENGAYQSFDREPDVGSPGTGVPEPCTILMLGLGGLALVRKRGSISS